MKRFIQYIIEHEFALPYYPEQVMAKDDPEGNWVTGDSVKPIDTFPEVDGKVRGVESTAAAIYKANAIIKKERETQKKKA